MARFIFQLDGVLRHRERIEKERQRDLALAEAQMVRLEGELRVMNEQIQQSTAAVRDGHLVGRLDMHYLAAHRRYMLGMQRKVIALAEKMALQQRQVEESRRALTEASKQKKILEKLRERHHQRWAAAIALREAGDLDELSTQLSFRNLTADMEDVT